MDIRKQHTLRVKRTRRTTTTPPPSAPAPAALPEQEIDFQTWNVFELNLIPWPLLGCSLTNSHVMPDGDLPPYALPALLIACQAKLMQKKVSIILHKDLEDFWKECIDQIENCTGESIWGFLNLGGEENKPDNRWKSTALNRDYNAGELEYIQDMWSAVNQEYEDGRATNSEMKDRGSDTQDPGTENRNADCRAARP
jgi:hypothetical protein